MPTENLKKKNRNRKNKTAHFKRCFVWGEDTWWINPTLALCLSERLPPNAFTLADFKRISWAISRCERAWKCLWLWLIVPTMPDLLNRSPHVCSCLICLQLRRLLRKLRFQIDYAFVFVLNNFGNGFCCNYVLLKIEF